MNLTLYTYLSTSGVEVLHASDCDEFYVPIHRVGELLVFALKGVQSESV